jgi:hypothetical protein
MMESINVLYVPTPCGDQIPLPFHQKKIMIMAILQLYHMKSQASSAPVDLTNMLKTDFSCF